MNIMDIEDKKERRTEMINFISKSLISDMTNKFEVEDRVFVLQNIGSSLICACIQWVAEGDEEKYYYHCIQKLIKDFNCMQELISEYKENKSGDK